MIKKSTFAIAFMLLLLSCSACSNRKALDTPTYPADTTVSMDVQTDPNDQATLGTSDASNESTTVTSQEFDVTDSEHTTASLPTTEVPESIQSSETSEKTTKAIETASSQATTKKTTTKSSKTEKTKASSKKATESTTSVIDDDSSEDGVVVLDDEDEVVILDDEDMGDDLLGTQDGGSSDQQDNTPDSAHGNSGNTTVDIGTSPTFLIERVPENTTGKTAVNVYVKNNPGITSIALSVSYDSALKLDSVVYNSSVKGETMLPQSMKNPVKLVWVSPFENVSGDFLLATLYFDTANVSTSGEHWISAAYNSDDVFDLSENNVSFNVNNGYIAVK